FTIFASVGIIYGLGILVSLWAGPLTFTEVRNVKRIEGLEVVRGVGFAEAVTVAGGVAAVFAGFQLFVWSHLTRMGPLLMLFGPAALIATLSRSAIVSFAASLAALGMLVMARAVYVRSVRTGGLRRAFQF